jgi:opacity protein-like surface antigen
MGSLKTLAIAGAVAMIATSAAPLAPAFAADLIPPPMMAPPPPPMDWAATASICAATSVSAEKRGDQAFAGVGVGYKFNNWFRADLTGEYRTAAEWNAIASYKPAAPPAACVTGRCFDHYTGRIANSVFLANAYADLGTWSGLTPFVGVGLGTAQHRFQSLTDVDHQLGAFGYAADKSSWKFAWALMAGLSYDVTQNLKLELGYRYLNMGKATSGHIVCQVPVGGACGNEVQRVKMDSHDIRLGMRWMLGGETAVAAAMPAPLVRKY